MLCIFPWLVRVGPGPWLIQKEPLANRQGPSTLSSPTWALGYMYCIPGSSKIFTHSSSVCSMEKTWMRQQLRVITGEIIQGPDRVKMRQQLSLITGEIIQGPDRVKMRQQWS